MQSSLHNMMAAGLAPFLAQLTTQQQAQLLNMPASRAPAVHVQPAQRQQQQDNQAALLASMTTIVENLAQTVRDLSALPGAAQLISPDMATVVQHLGAVKAAPAQRPVTPVSTKDLNNAGHINPQDSLNKQRPTTPPALLRTSAQHSPVTPSGSMPAQSSCAGNPAAPGLEPMRGVLNQPAGLLDSAAPAEGSQLQGVQMSAQGAQLPTNQAMAMGSQARLPSGTVTTDSSSDSDGEAHNAKRARRDAKVPADSAHGMLMAQRALAAVMGLKQHQQGPGQPATLPALSAAPAAPSPAVFGALPYALPLVMTLPGSSTTSTGTGAGHQAGAGAGAGFAVPAQERPKLQMPAKRAASVHEMMEAAEILTGLHNNIHSPMASDNQQLDEAYSEPWSPHMQGMMEVEHGWGMPIAAAAAGACKPPAKPRGRPPGKKGSKGRRTGRQADKPHFQCEAEEVSDETKAALLLMWTEHNESLPVFCANHTSGIRADGTFKIIDGKRKIVASDGTVMDPVDFEKAGDRATTRNWQLSICVTGLHTKPGSRTDLKLGHATRILGVHNPVPGQPVSPVAAQ